MKKYFTGHKPDPAGYRRSPFRLLGALKGGLEEPSTLPDFATVPNMPLVLDQGQTSSCTGHASSIAISAAIPSLGFVPSPWLNYTNGRCMQRLDSDTLQAPLTDDGCAPNEVFRGINAWGVIPMRGPTLDGRNSDCSPDNITQEPDESVEEDASKDIIIGEYGISAIGAQRAVQVRQAISMGHAICISVAGGSDAVQGYQQGQVLSATGQPLDHYVCVYRYRLRTDGSYIYCYRNSWGSSYGDAGDFWGDDSFLQECGDLVVCDVKVAT